MLLDEIKKIKSTPKELREFGFVVGGFLLLLAGIRAWHHGAWDWPLVAGGAALAVAGLTIPRALTPLQKVWMALALVMGAVMSRVILCLVFFAVLTPLALILRLQGKRFLQRIGETTTGSYWNLRGAESDDPKRCERQY